jgi:ankyrin repeat protein
MHAHPRKLSPLCAQGVTPLHFAIRNGHTDLVSTIVRVEPRALEAVALEVGFTPLLWTIYCNQTAILRKLLCLGANASQPVLQNVRPHGVVSNTVSKHGRGEEGAVSRRICTGFSPPSFSLPGCNRGASANRVPHQLAPL